MKVKSILLVLCVVLCIGTTARAESSVKIGFVDFYRALSEVNEGKKVLAQLEKEGKEKQQKMELKNETKMLISESRECVLFFARQPFTFYVQAALVICIHSRENI